MTPMQSTTSIIGIEGKPFGLPVFFILSQRTDVRTQIETKAQVVHAAHHLPFSLPSIPLLQ